MILAGLLALGVREYARTSETFAARWEQIKFTLLAVALILLGIIATVLAIGFIIAVVVIEIWRPLLIAAVIVGLVASFVWVRRPRS